MHVKFFILVYCVFRMGKIEGIRTIQKLAKIHPDVVQAHLHPVVLSLLTEVKNLRSSVARAAILAVGDLFVSLKKNVEPVSFIYLMFFEVI